MKTFKNFWAYLEKGTKLQHMFQGKVSFTTLNKRTRAWMVLHPESSYGYDPEYPITAYIMEYGNNMGVHKDSKYTVDKVPPLKKEFRTLAVKGSVWEVTQDLSLEGYSKKPIKLKKGTRLTIADNKMKQGGWPLFLWLQVEAGAFKEPWDKPFYKNQMVDELPAQEVSHYLKLISAGKPKTYWRLLDHEGNKVTPKRFKNLGAVKASVRVRLGLVKESDEVPYWLENSRPEHFKRWKAVEFDHATDKELSHEDLSDWVFITAL